MSTSKPPSKHKPKQQQYEELGKMLENIYESGYINRNEAYKMSFIKGMLSGLGGVLGATILVGILLWALTLFKEVPFVNRITNNIQHSVKQQPEAK